MTLYVGLDVSQKETEICVVDNDGLRTWRGKCPSEPERIAAMLREHAPDVARVGMETGHCRSGFGTDYARSAFQLTASMLVMSLRRCRYRSTRRTRTTHMGSRKWCVPVGIERLR
jgi:hypothetical protein